MTRISSRVAFLSVGIAMLAVPTPAAHRLSIVDLGTLPGGDYSSASDINNHGQIVGASRVSGLSFVPSSGKTA